MFYLTKQILVSILFLTSSLYAFDHKKFYEILEQPHRPTIKETQTIFEESDSAFRFFSGFLVNEREHQLKSTIADYGQMIALHGPEFIAQVDSMYPGANVISLGRDSAMVADLFEAFYLAHGQERRAFRLEASGSTISLLKEGELVQYFKQLGYNYSDPKSIDNLPPLILIDRSPYSSSSQSTRVLESLYEAYKNAGGDLKNLFTKLAFFGTINGGKGPDSYRRVLPILDAKKNNFFARLFQKMQSIYAMRSTYAYPANFLYTPHWSLGYEKIGSGLNADPIWSDVGYWHDTFGSFASRYEGGTLVEVKGVPGKLLSVTQRRQLIFMQYEIIRATKTPEFLNSVKRISKDYFEHDFKLQYGFLPPRAYEPKPYSLKDAMQNFEKKFSELKEAGDHSDKVRYSENGKFAFETFGSFLEEATYEKKNEQFLLASLALFSKLKTQKIIDGRDFRYLIAHVFSVSEGSDEFYKQLISLAERDQVFLKMLIKKSEYFLDSNPKRKGGVKVVEVYKKIQDGLKALSKVSDCEVEFGAGL